MDRDAVLAMYDIRGIQKYIFKTTKVKEAMGASALVDTIIMDALNDAVEKLGLEEQAELDWYDEHGPIPYVEHGHAIQVLFVGGGNAYVMFETKELCLNINRHMARYILEETYSLQLAVAVEAVSWNYQKDYDNLRKKMDEIKSKATVSHPYGALPIMKVERSTGYPAICTREGQDISSETYLKQERKRQCKESEDEKIFDKLIEEKGVDSTLAVVHIDGNDMGRRIREHIKTATTYTEAVNRMRTLSYHIKFSYQNVFEQMYQRFNEKSSQLEQFHKKEAMCFIRKILVAGDDITYVCSGKIALATVEYFCREISKMTMTGQQDEESLCEQRFSVCAGVAFMGSHFPFSVAYEVAEECCAQVKAKAKRPKSMDGSKIANYVDFQICKNIQTRNLELTRKREYETYLGEHLLCRPYYIPTEGDGTFGKLREKELDSFAVLKKVIRYFQNGTNIPRSHAKTLRNTYPLGSHQVDQLMAFFNSRNIKMPDETMELYADGRAKWYDALEMMDLFISLEEIEGKEVLE